MAFQVLEPPTSILEYLHGKDPQKSPASVRIAVKDLKVPALHSRRLAASVSRVILECGM